MMTQQDCQRCTVPTENPDGICTFCKTYTPPTPGPTAVQVLDDSVNRIDDARHRLNKELQALPADAPLMAVVDLVTALGHLRQAAVLLDKANDQLEAVQR